MVLQLLVANPVSGPSAHGDLRQVAHVKAPNIDGRVGGTRVPSPDVQWRREGMIADVGRIVARAAGSLKRGNAARNQTTCRHVVVYSGHAGDVDGFGIENGLPARNGCSRIREGSAAQALKVLKIAELN